jgi:hypothetical protein
MTIVAFFRAEVCKASFVRAYMNAYAAGIVLTPALETQLAALVGDEGLHQRAWEFCIATNTDPASLTARHAMQKHGISTDDKALAQEFFLRPALQR